MITFKSTQDLQKLTSDNPAHPIIQELDQLIRAYTWEAHPYFTEDYGYIVLIEPQDTERVLDEIWYDWTLLGIPWEEREKIYLCRFQQRVSLEDTLRLFPSRCFTREP